MKYHLVIRFTSTTASSKQLKDLELPLVINTEKDDVNKLVSVRWLKSTIRSDVPECQSKRLRLIYNGRILNENTDFKSEVFDPKTKQLNSDNQTQEEKIYIHCLVGEELAKDQLAKENQLDNKPQEVSTNPEVTGFDRLLQQGFSQDDVNDLRRQFHLIYNPNEPTSSDADQIMNLEEEEQRENTARQLEERWIESTMSGTPNRQEPPNAATEEREDGTPQPLVDLDDANANEDLLIGLLVGIFLGVVSLIFLVADDTIFNKRQRMSIIAGVFINFSFAIVRGLQM
ncbi:uncharacterized protein PRCAT00000446001 [Priceomyces carsonii]|uniref:uncharacterized protein n=1 Tax=Priceomyces carsonii TaxID=28549 RepID=UPI002ED905F1|nr:unnamed protein product [Priceomyces carsonii]